jgi:KDEL-tailed cysteine endopeptidase
MFAQRTALLLAFLFCISSSTFAHDFTTCKNQHGDPMGVKSVNFAPDPPRSGKSVTVTVKGSPLTDITEGQLHVDVRVLGITVNSQVLEVCDILKCPVKAGEEYSGNVVQEIPEGTPDRMGATVRMTLVTKGKTLTCLESYVQITNAPETGLLEGEDSKKEVVGKDIEFLFSKWKKQFPKAAADFKKFALNMMKIVTHNNKKDKTYTMAMNEFGSMTEEEFAESRMGVREPREDVHRNGPLQPRVTVLRQEVASADPPAEVDWSAKGVVAPVKNQGSCGSCWAFSAVAAIESAYAIKTSTLVRLSEQELVSCDDNDYGCQGGLMDSAFDWIERSTTGLCSETDYPYTSGLTSARGECMKNQCTPVPGTVPKGYVDIPPNESALLAAVAQHGPVAVAIQADQTAFQFYHSGVLTGACGNHLNHGVLLVGYGVDTTTGTPYWKVKNSWGAGWGEAGFVRIQKGKRWPPVAGGSCGIALKASYPVL